jgi:energy-coupling factor transporter ATP-binding protein EcfA2
MKIQVRNNCSDFNSYRAARVKSLFNCESGANFSIDADLPLEDQDWTIGVVVGPSGSGKTSIGRSIWPDVGIYDGDEGWPADKPIVDAIAPKGGFDDVTGALSAVGLGSVPAWLRPYHALSNGEKFRAGLARIIAEGKQRVIIDEFTSVVDRQIAKVGAGAFSKSWKRGGGQAVLLSCHYDILDWVEPDWVFDTRTGELQRGSLWRRPKFELEVFATNGSYWPMFEPHHYLKLPRMISAKYYVGFIEGEAVCHLASSPALQSAGMRLARMVVMPEWQGAGVGMKFLNEVARLQFTDANPHKDRVKAVYFQTSHPRLCKSLRTDKRWTQISQMLGGVNKGSSAKSVISSQGGKGTQLTGASAGYGGHHRAVQGFKMTKQSAVVA